MDVKIKRSVRRKFSVNGELTGRFPVHITNGGRMRRDHNAFPRELVKNALN